MTAALSLQHVPDRIPAATLLRDVPGLPMACFHTEASGCSRNRPLFALRGHTGFPILSCTDHLTHDLEAMTVRGHVVTIERIAR